MQLLIDATDLATAPIDVRSWILGRLGPTEYSVVESPIPAVGAPLPTESPAKASEPTGDTKAANAEQEEPVTLFTVQQKATELIEAKGKEVAKELLKKLGLKKFTDCPDDKLASCLAEIAKAL